MSLVYRELTPEEFAKAPREVEGSEIFTPDNSRIIAAINEKGEIVATWTAFAMIHIEPFWVREDYRGNSRIMLRMTQAMRKMLRESGVQSVYTVVMEKTPVLKKFAEWWGAKKVEGDLYYWVDTGSDILKEGKE